MIPHPTLHWHEILAAYADGEFEGRDDLAVLKQRVEDWLARHPEARAELARIRELKQLWQETTPPSPSSGAWQAALRKLANAPATLPPTRSRWRRSLGVATALAACIALVVTLEILQRPAPPPTAPPQEPVVLDDELPFPVAAAHEVEILNVEGADTHTLVVGELPLQGTLELASPGDVTVTSVEPAARDNMMPEIHLQGPGRPMIYARLDDD
jgi:anti-sigma factor RsiW